MRPGKSSRPFFIRFLVRRTAIGGNQPRGNARSGGHQVLIGHNLIDQAPAEGGFGVQCFPKSSGALAR
jgi:hypothetical protein